jgi:hypothetical protein
MSGFVSDSSESALSAILDQADSQGSDSVSEEGVENEEGLQASEEEQTEETKIEEKKEEDPLSRKFAALSRKEKEIRQKSADLDRKMAELEAKMASLEKGNQPDVPKTPELSMEQLLRKSPFEALEKAGYDLNTLAQIALNEGKLPQEMQIKLMREDMESQFKSQLEELKSQLAEKESKQEQQKYEQVIQNFKSEIVSTAKSNEEKYELVNSIENYDLVFDTIQEHYNETGEILDVESALQAVEDYLLAESQKILKANKARKLIESKTQPTKTETKPKSPTLTNSNSAQTPQKDNGLLSDEASLREAAKLIKWFE